MPSVRRARFSAEMPNIGARNTVMVRLKTTTGASTVSAPAVSAWVAAALAGGVCARTIGALGTPNTIASNRRHDRCMRGIMAERRPGFQAPAAAPTMPGREPVLRTPPDHESAVAKRAQRSHTLAR
jgi:hypothetical protein